jgi:hypothetical protein
LASDPTIKWAARLAGVREVTLHGVADLAYWTDRLAPEGLSPLAGDGRAQLLLIAAAARFRGVRFRELNFSVVVAPTGATTASTDAVYLVHAFNSNRFFAWCERTLFSTPYTHADVRVDAGAPASIELSQNGRTVFRAARLAIPGAPRPLPAPGGWAGAVHLPRQSLRSPARHFVAEIRGETESVAFDAGDNVTLNPSPDAAIIQSLVDSRFTPTQWELRPVANHSKSKTYTR